MLNDTKVEEKYLPMTETAFYILLVLDEPLHGYGVILAVEQLTKSRLRLGAGTVYGTLTKMEQDGLITVIREEDRRKLYQQTQLGNAIVEKELDRLGLLFSQGMNWRNRHAEKHNEKGNMLVGMEK